MRAYRWRAAICVVGSLSLLPFSAAADTTPSASEPRVEAALANIAALERPGQIGLATIWDGNKYVQCRRMRDHVLRCEAAGALMQPSLAHVLAPERIARLETLGWRLDPSFGNYLQVFPADLAAKQAAERIIQALAEGYGADVSNLEVESDWMRDQPCPPRNGPGQNLAGMINDAPSMRATAIYECSYTPPPTPGIASAADVVGRYSARTTGEIQRLRININRRVFIVLQTDLGYLQCDTDSSSASIYCEAESADEWPALAGVLTPDRIERLHAAGYADPGRAPNYSRNYPLKDFDDAAIARELLMILYDVYGYRGSPDLAFMTEGGH